MYSLKVKTKCFELVKQGHSIAETAKILGVSYSAVRQWIKNQDSIQYDFVERRKEEIREWIATGLPTEELAQKLGYKTTATIFIAARKYGFSASDFTSVKGGSLKSILSEDLVNLTPLEVALKYKVPEYNVWRYKRIIGAKPKEVTEAAVRPEKINPFLSRKF